MRLGAKMLDLQQARLDWIDPNHYTQGHAVDVVEKNPSGRGTVRFELAEGETALKFKLSEQTRFACIRQKKAAETNNGVRHHFWSCVRHGR